jgi:hypothetical protein
MTSLNSRRHGRRAQTVVALPFVLAGLIASMALTGGAGATTGPAAVYVLHAVMTNSKIVLVPTASDRQYIKQGGLKAFFTRGSVITFQVKNKSNKPLIPAIHVLNTANEDPADHPLQYYKAQRVAKPGQSVDLQINFYFRAPYQLLQLSNNKPVGKSVLIQVS